MDSSDYRNSVLFLRNSFEFPCAAARSPQDQASLCNTVMGDDRIQVLLCSPSSIPLRLCLCPLLLFLHFIFETKSHYPILSGLEFAL